jgi:hypothetical protein
VPQADTLALDENHSQAIWWRAIFVATDLVAADLVAADLDLAILCATVDG